MSILMHANKHLNKEETTLSLCTHESKLDTVFINLTCTINVKLMSII